MNWRDRFSKFMYGRYGADQFSKFLLGLTIALCIISLFVPRRLGSLFSTLILLLIFYIASFVYYCLPFVVYL